MALFDKLKSSLYGLKGEQGPTFENEGQSSSSNIQALTKGNNLISSQDLSSGRKYGQGATQVKVNSSKLDLNGKTPNGYVKNTDSNLLNKNLPASQLGMKGKTQQPFESVSQRTTSDLQALAKGNNLVNSQDLLTGRKYGKGRFSVFIPASQLDGNGLPIGSSYKSKGPKEGKY